MLNTVVKFELETFAKSMENMQAKLQEKKDLISEAEKELKNLKAKAEDEKLMPTIQKAYDDLAAKLKEAKSNEFMVHKKDILEYLEGEIVRRYFFRKGVVEHDFEYDEDIKESLKLLDNQSEFNKLLKK